MANNGRVVIEIEGNWKKLFKQAQGVVDNLGESISDELYQSMEQAFSRLSKIDIDAKLVSVFNRFQNAISKTKDPLKIQDAIRQFDESAKFFESIEKMASSNGINNVFLGIDKDGLKDFISLADKVIAKQQELLKYNNRTKEYSRNYDEMIGENGKYTLKSLDDVIKFTGHKSSDEKKYIAHVGQFFKEKVVGKTDKYQDTINEFGKLVGLLFELENQKFEADDIRSVQKEMGLDIIRGQIRNLFNNSNDATKKLINQYAKDNKVKLGIKDKPYDLQKDYGNFARATTDRINSDINDITQQAYTLILNEAQKVSESFQDRDKQIGTVLEGFAKEVAEAFNQLDETFKKKYSTKDISEIKDKLKAAYEKFANNYKGGKLTDDTFNDLKEVIGYYQRFLTLGGTESDMLGFDWFDKNHRTLVTGTSKHLTSTSYGKEINELTKNIQLLSQVIDQIGTGVGGSGAGIGGGSGDGSGNGSGSGEGSGNGGFGSGVDKESLNEFTTAIVSKLEELKTVVNEIKNNTEQNKSQDTNGIDIKALADSIYETTTNTATIKNNTNDIVEIKRILEQEINTVINTISTSIGGIDLSSIDNHLSRIGNLLDDISKLTPSLGGQNNIIKGIFGDVIDIIIAQMRSNDFLMKNGKTTNERAMYFGENYISDPFFHGTEGSVASYLVREQLEKEGALDKIKYKVHTHPNRKNVQMSFSFFSDGDLQGGDIKSFYNDYLTEGLDIEEQLIAGLDEIQVFLAKKFYDEHEDLLNKNFEHKKKDGTIYTNDFSTEFANDQDKLSKYINDSKNADKEKTQSIMFDAFKKYGVFNLEDNDYIDMSKIEAIDANIAKIFKDNINKYIENIENDIKDKNKRGKTLDGIIDGTIISSLQRSMRTDGINENSVAAKTIMEEIINGIRRAKGIEYEDFYQSKYAAIVEHLLSQDKYGNIKYSDYTKHYSLKKEDDIKFLHEKYGNQMFNALKQEQESANVGLGISPDFDADEFINQIIVTIGDKKIPVKVSPDIDPEDFINQILTAIGEKEFPIKIAPNDESLNELTNMIGSKLSENENLEKLNTILGEIIQKIERKNELFNEEQSIVSNVTESEVNDLNKVRDAVNEISEAIKNKNDLLNNTQQSPISQVSSEELYTEKGQDGGEGYAEGIINAIPDAEVAGKKLVDKTLDTVQEAQKSNSPAKEFEELSEEEYKKAFVKMQERTKDIENKSYHKFEWQDFASANSRYVVKTHSVTGDSWDSGTYDTMKAAKDAIKRMPTDAGEMYSVEEVNEYRLSIEECNIAKEKAKIANEMLKRSNDELTDSENNLTNSIESVGEAVGNSVLNATPISPTQTFDNEIQQNLVMLENYENTLKEIDKLKLEPDTDETKAKIQELNKLADYFASKITTIRSENGHEVNRSMMYFNGLPNPNLQEHYESKDIKRFDKVAGDRSGLNIDKVSTEFYGIDEEIKNIELQSESLRHSLNEALSESRDYVKKLSTKLLDLVDSTLELKTMTNKKDIDDETNWIDNILKKYPELEKFKDKFTSYGAAKDFVKSDEWNDFLATLPQAHTYLENIGYDFERIKDNSNNNVINNENEIISNPIQEPLSPIDETSSNNVSDETEHLKELSNELEEVERRVGLKTMAFVNEKGEVEKVVNIEKSKLNELKESVESVSNSVNDLAQGLKEVSDYANNTIKLEVKNKDGNTSTSPSAGSSTDGLNGDTILGEQLFNIDDLKEKNKGIAELEKRLGGVLDVVKQIRKGKDGDYVSFRLTGEKGSAWVGANGDVLRLTTKDKTDYTDKKKKDKQDRDIWDKQYHNAIKDNFIMTQKASRKIWDKDYENAMKENYKRDYKKQRDIWDKAYSEAQKENYKFDKIDEAKKRKIWDDDYEKAIKENYLRDLKSSRKIWDDAYNAAYKENRKRDRKIWDKDYNNAYKENYKRDQAIKKEQEKQDTKAKKEQEKKDAQRQKLYAKDAFDQVAAQKKEQEKQEKRLNKMSMDQAKGDAKRRINALETVSKLSSNENKYFTDSYYKNLFESQVGQSATATFKDQKDATHWQGLLVDNEMQAIIDAQSKLIAAEKEFDKVKKNFDNDSVTYADRYTEVVKKLNDAREEFAKLNADEFYKGNKTGISNDLVEKYEKQNTTLKDTLLARESRNNSNGVEGNTNEVLEKRRERLLKLIEVFDVYLSKIDSYPEHAEKIKQTHDQLELFYNGSTDLISDDDLDKIDRFGKQLKNVDKLAKENRIEKLIGSITEFMRRNSKMSRESADEFQNLINKLKSGNLLESEIDGISTSFEKLKTKMRETGEVGRSFFDVFKQKITYLTAQQLAMYFSFNDIIRYGRTVIQNIVEINTQFTELAKVSDTSIKQLNADFKSYAETSKEVGSAISDTISATADWARMGYNIPDSKELAKVALLYKNVGDGIDISTANESLISTLQGFQMEASDAMEIVDKFNEVSNNFAISSGGIGEALKRSAASFNAANTDLSKSIALVTTTNTVLQDPQVVGNLWKTMSARLRGAKTELEDLGEEEDEFTESTSKLQKLVKSLTGFDIMKDSDTFKDLYDIMIGIGEKWQDLTDIERASLGEALAGKRMANGLYAVLNNIDTLKKAYNTAEDSAGSAMREQENYQKSIQCSIEVLKASFQELSHELIDSDAVKFVVDIANGLVNITSEVIRLIDLIPMLTAAVAALASVKTNSGFFRMYDVIDNNGNTVSKFGTAIGENRYNNKDVIIQNKISKIGSNAISKYGKLISSGVSQTDALSIAFDNADAKLNKFVNGSLKDFVSEYDNANDALNAWNEQQAKSIEIYKSTATAAGKATSAINILSTAAKAIGNMIVFGAIAKVLEKAVNIFNDIRNTNNDIEWIGDSANNASNKIKEVSESVDDYKNKIKDLYKTINDKSSTDDQVIKARTDLLDLQKQMIEKYGDEETKLNDITKATLGYVDALDSLKSAAYQEQRNEFDKKKDFFEDPSDWVYKKSQNYSGQIDQMVKEYLTTQTETFDMDALGVDLSKLSEEKLNALKELGVQLKVYNGESKDDPIGRKWIRNISDNKAFATGLLYKAGKADKVNTRDFDPLTDSLSETNGIMLQIDANGKDMKNTIIGIQEIFRDENGLDTFNSKLAEIADNFTKLEEAYGSFAPQYVAEELINNKYDNLPLEDYFKEIENAKDAYEKAFNNGNKKEILQSTVDYIKIVGEKQNKLTEFVNAGKLSEENAQIISDYFQDAFSDTMDAAIENLKITIDLSKNIDIKSIKGNGLTQEDINEIYSLYTLYYNDVQKIANKVKSDAVSNSDITPFLGVGENYGLTEEQTKEVVEGYKNVVSKISKETNPDAYWSALTGKASEFSKWYEQGISAEDYEAIAKLIISNATKNADKDLQDAIDAGMNDAAKELGMSTEDFMKVYGSATNGIGHLFEYCKENGLELEWVLNMLGIKSRELEEEQDKLSYDMVKGIKETKDSAKSLMETLEQLKLGELSSEDLIDFLGNEDNKDFIQSVNNLEDKLIASIKIKRKEALNSVKDLADEERTYWENIINETYNKLEYDTHVNALNSSIDKLQEGLKTLSSAFDEYNENGFITLDTLQSLTAENGEYLSMLTIENGQLKINEEAYKAQVAAKLNELKVTLSEAAANEINALAQAKANGETDKGVGKLNALSIAYETATASAAAFAREQGVTDEEINEIIDKYDTIFNKAADGFNNNFKVFSGATTSSASDAADKLKEELDNFIAYQDALLDAGKISYDEYTKNVRGKLDSLYSSGKLTAKDYFDYVQKLLEKQLSIYDEVLSAVARRYDKEIEKIDDQIEAINEENDALNKQKDEYDKILSVVQEVYDKEIESLQDQQEAIQDKIDALQKANDEEDRALALANARYALEKAQQQRTRLVYNGAEGFVYQTDPEAIRNAKKELKDAELENTVAALEEEKEALDKTIENLEEYKEKWSEISEVYDKEVNRQLAIALWGENYEQMILQNREQDIQEFTNKYVDLQKKVDDNTSLIESFEEKKKYYEELKEQWQEITDIYKNSIEDQHTAMVLGADWENDILSGRTATLEKFKNEYIAIQEQIKQAAIDSANAQAAADKGGSGSSSGGGFDSGMTVSSDKKAYEVINNHGDNATGAYYSTKEEAEEARKAMATKDPRDLGSVREITGVSGFKILRQNANGTLQKFGNDKLYDTYEDAVKVLNDPNSEYNKKLNEGWKFVIKLQKFAKGGVINANNNNPLNNIASKLGEDTAVLARHGERILTPVQNQYWEKWTNAIPNLTKHLEQLKFNTPNLSSILNAVASKETTVKQEISISLPNVTNTSGAEYVINALKTLPLEAVQRVNRR